MKKILFVLIMLFLCQPLWANNPCSTAIDGHVVCDFEVTTYEGVPDFPTSDAGTARIYFDSDTNTLQCSQNGEAYSACYNENVGISNVVEDATPQLGGDLDLNGKNIDFPTTANISDVIDDDTMAAASAVKLATSESIKVYVDTQDSAQDACSEITGCVENAITAADVAANETDPQVGDVGTTPNDICIGDGDSVECTLTPNAGTDVTADLEEESHASEHAVGGGDTTFPADPNADAMLMWDDSGGALEFNVRYQDECHTIEDPVDADDNIPYWAWREASTITDVYCRADGGGTITLVLGDGTNSLESITCDADGQEDDGSITNGTFTSLEVVEADHGAPSGTVDWLIVCVTRILTAD